MSLTNVTGLVTLFWNSDECRRVSSRPITSPPSLQPLISADSLCSIKNLYSSFGYSGKQSSLIWQAPPFHVQNAGIDTDAEHSLEQWLRQRVIVCYCLRWCNDAGSCSVGTYAACVFHSPFPGPWAMKVNKVYLLFIAWNRTFIHSLHSITCAMNVTIRSERQKTVCFLDRPRPSPLVFPRQAST